MAAAPLFRPDWELSPAVAGMPALAVAASSSGSATAARKGPLRAAGYAEKARPRVLIVDPDERARSVLETRLSAEGYDVDAVGSSADALRQLGPSRPLPSVVISEAELSGTDGFALCAQLRAEERTAQVPFILLAASSEASQGELAGMAAADLLLPKPVFANDVVTVVRLWSGQGAQARFLETTTAQVPLAHALRALLSTTRAGRIYLKHGRAQLSFRDGRVVDASFDSLRGSEAVARMVLLSEGEYALSLGPSLVRASCSFGLQELCGRVFPRLARWQKLLERSVPLDAVLAVDFKRLTEELERLPEELNPVIRLFDGYRSLRDVLRECELGEVTTLESVNRLYMLGVLMPTRPPDVDDELHPRAPAGGLFEPEPTEAVERMAQLFGESVPAPVEKHTPVGYDWFTDVEQLGLQLRAFQIQPVVEQSEPEHPSPEVADFGRGIGEAAPASPMTDAFENLEDSFFNDAAHAVPEVPASPPPRERRSPLRMFALSFATVMALGLGAWAVARVTASQPPVLPPPAVAVVQPLRAVPAPAMAAPEEPLPTLADGVKLYDEGKAADAAVVLARVVDAEPLLANAWLMLGLARFDSGDTVGAQDAAARAAELDPKDGRVHMLLASIHIAQGDRVKAQPELARYLELEPQGEFAQEAHQLLAQP